MPSVPANYRRLEGSERSARKGTRRTGPVDPNERVRVTICVRRRPDGPPVPDHDHWVKTPPGRRRFLSKGEFAASYGATPEDLGVVERFAKRQWLCRRLFERCPAGRHRRGNGRADERGLPRRSRSLRISSTEKHRGREGFIHLPNEVADVVEGVFGLDTRRMARRATTFVPAASLTPVQVASNYNFPSGNAPQSDDRGLRIFSDPN